MVEDQRLVGIVTLQNLMHSMALLAESRKLRSRVKEKKAEAEAWHKRAEQANNARSPIGKDMKQLLVGV